MSNNIIVLAGPPCSGKSTIGKILSSLLHADFIDIDSLIQEESKHTIEWIFNHQGEEAFRAAEKRILAEVISDTAYSTGRAVIALGGGALLDTENEKLVMKNSILFTLSASIETLIARNEGKRPLSSNADALKKLMHRREQHYLSLCNQVNTDNRSARQVAEEIRTAALPLLSPPVRPS